MYMQYTQKISSNPLTTTVISFTSNHALLEHFSITILLVKAHVDMVPGKIVSQISSNDLEWSIHDRNKLECYLPMVLSNAIAVLHGAPALPGTNLISRRVPNLLAPNDILDIVCASTVHDPFGNVISGECGFL